MKTVYAYVCADILNIGHVIHLQKAANQGFLIVGVLTKAAIMEKKSAPIISYKERAEIIGALKSVGLVYPQKTYSPIPNILKIKPSIIIESSSHDKKDIESVKKVAKSYGGKVIVIRYYTKQSSSKIKERIKNGN